MVHHLREELLVATVTARTVMFSERHLASREREGTTVPEASAKGEVKDHLGRSPDFLNAGLMAMSVVRTMPSAAVLVTIMADGGLFGKGDHDNTLDDTDRNR